MKNFFDKFFLLTLFVLSANIATGQVVEGDTVISMVILTSPVDPPDTILIRTPHQLHPDTIKVKLLISDENDVLKIIKGYIIDYPYPRPIIFGVPVVRYLDARKESLPGQLLVWNTIYWRWD